MDFAANVYFYYYASRHYEDWNKMFRLLGITDDAVL